MRTGPSRPIRRIEAHPAADIDRTAWWARIPAVRALVVVATHSPLLTALPDATVLELGDHGIRKVGWADLEVVRQWRAFLAHPADQLAPLLRPGPPRPSR